MRGFTAEIERELTKTIQDRVAAGGSQSVYTFNRTFGSGS